MENKQKVGKTSFKLYPAAGTNPSIYPFIKKKRGLANCSINKLPLQKELLEDGKVDRKQKPYCPV